jgi:twitching motility protein PilT
MDKAALETLLAGMVRSDATTLHLVAGHKPWMRMAGALVACNLPTLTNQHLEDLGGEFLFDDHRQRVSRGEEVQVLYSSQDCVRFRTVVARQAHGLSMVFRRIPNKIPTIAELDLPPLTSSFVEFHSGLVLATGFWGSGKSWTLAALVDHVNQNSQHHVVTIESPIDFIHSSVKSMVHQREVGFHVDSFASGIRDACRHDARVIMVSEIHDYETLEACLGAVDEDRARTRLRLASNLRVMMSQHLLNKVGGRGRVPLVEILINNQAVGKAIRAGKFQDLPALMQKGRGLGMQTADIGLRSLLLKGVITQEEALYHAVDRDSVLARRGSPLSL